MATSGTVGQTTINVTEIIESSVRRCGKMAQEITPEWLDIGKKNLFYIIQFLANRSVSLWTIEKAILGFLVGEQKLTFPVGTIDILHGGSLHRDVSIPTNGAPFSSAGGIASNAFDQNLDTSCTQTVANGYISYIYPDNTTITSVAIMTKGNQTYNLVWEYTSDGITWTQVLATNSQSYTDKQWAWYDIEYPQQGIGFRVRETGGGILDVREIVFSNQYNEVQIARYNRDDYFNLPNKMQQGRPMQFWYDRQIPQPFAHIWPTPNNNFNCACFYIYRQIQDIGALTNEIQVPQRWYGAIVDMLSYRMSFELPAVDPERRAELKVEHDQSFKTANDEEIDVSPFRIQARIGPYTQ